MFQSTIKYVVLFACAAALAAAAPETPPASEYAPAKDLQAQFDEYLADLNSSLESEDAYSEAKQGTVLKLSNTLAAMALVMANHDEDNQVKPHASAIVAAAGELSKSSKEFASAKAALAKLQKAAAGEAPAGEALGWQQVGDLVGMMEQIPVINSKLKRSIRRLDRSQDDAAMQAATLAAIAQATMLHPPEDADAAQLAEWHEFSGQMRDAAGETIAAIRALDEAAVEASMEKMTISCDACHDEFQE